jgi:hypothetical protein
MELQEYHYWVGDWSQLRIERTLRAGKGDLASEMTLLNPPYQLKAKVALHFLEEF